jgi:hypothetical protein
LLLIGAAAIAGVLVYNRVQERATRREAQRAFASRHADVLLEEPLEEPSGRREPTLAPAPPDSDRPEPRESRPPRPEVDPRLDYLIELEGGTTPAAAWTPLERRFGRRAAFSETAAALQMVSRNGVVAESELAEFRAYVQRIARAHGAEVSAPPVRDALEGAQALDRGCAEVDVQVALHVLGPASEKVEGGPFSVTPRADGVTLLMDVPRTPALAQSYAAMVAAARRLGGRVVDDNGNALDERALAAIGVEVEALRARLAQLGIEPGSPLALRLFS